MKYQIVKEGSENSMRLQSIGIVLGTPAGELKKGDTLMWNFGYKSNIESIVKETAKTIVVSVNCGGKLYERKLNKTRLVCKLTN